MLWRTVCASVCVLAVLVQPWWSLPRLQTVSAVACTPPQGVTALVTRADGAFLAGTAAGQLWQRSLDGQCWSLQRSFSPRAVIGLLYAPDARPAILLAGSSRLSTSETVVPLQRSADGGKTWATALTGLPAATLPTQLAASTDGTLLLSYICSGSHQCAGLARSTDDGKTWRAAGPPIGHDYARVPMVISLSAGAFLLVAPSMARHSPAYAYRSRDDGQSWQKLGALPAQPEDLTVLFGLPWDAQRILAGFGVEYLDPFLLSSVDGGAAFSQQVRLAQPAGSLGACVCGFAALTVTHTLLAASLSFLSRSTDGGHTWQLVTSAPLKGLIIWLLQTAPDGRTVYAGTDKGVYRSVDDGRSWRDMSS
jgi:hypothetical protein